MVVRLTANYKGVLPMNIFRNISNAMARFMYGRNGSDQLNFAMLIAIIILNLAQYPAASFSSLFGNIIGGLSTALCVLVIFRMFSKNLPKRRSENQAFTTWWWPIKRKFTTAKSHKADKDHKYFTCKTCKTTCRVPVGKGKVVITCPKCKNKIEAKT